MCGVFYNLYHIFIHVHEWIHQLDSTTTQTNKVAIGL